METGEMRRLVCGQHVFARYQDPGAPVEFKAARFVKLVRVAEQWAQNGAGGHVAYDLAQVEDATDSTIRWLVTAGQLRSA